MTLEQRVEKLEQQVLNLQTTLCVRTAETQSLLALLRPAGSAEGAEGADYDQRFLEGRNDRLQILLLLLERTDPALAAKLSDLLAQPGLNFPVDWD